MLGFTEVLDHEAIPTAVPRKKMGNEQRYVSTDLTHFVGASLKDVDGKFEHVKQYELFTKIFSEGWLTHPPHAKLRDAGFRGFVSQFDPTGAPISAPHPGLGIPPFNIDIFDDLSENRAINCPYVCFCDIPHGDLDVHMQKYGNFGISFRKSFLTTHGVNPVFYVANNSTVMHRFRSHIASFDPNFADHLIPSYPQYNPGPRGSYFSDTILDICLHLQMLCTFCGMGYRDDKAASSKTNILKLVGIYVETNFPGFPVEFLDTLYDRFNNSPAIKESIWAYVEFLYRHVFGYMKFFDAGKEDFDPNNYYMEREWRLPGDLNFKQDNVCRVYLPEVFAKRFRSQFPNYLGQLSFSE